VSLRSRLDALESALSLGVPEVVLSWPPGDGLYPLPDDEERKVPWDEYVRWHVEHGLPRPIRLAWPGQHSTDAETE